MCHPNASYSSNEVSWPSAMDQARARWWGCKDSKTWALVSSQPEEGRGQTHRQVITTQCGKYHYRGGAERWQPRWGALNELPTAVKQITPKRSSLKQALLISQMVWESGIWEWCSWVVLAWGLSWGFCVLCWLIAFSDDLPGMGNPLSSSLAWLLAGGHPSWPCGPLCGSAQDSSLPEASHWERERVCERALEVIA